MKTEIKTIEGINCYEQDGTAYLKLEDVARGLGFTRTADSGNEVVRWERVDGYLKELSVPTCGHDGFIPENIFYRLAMKAKNSTAEAFQAKMADEVIPAIRKHGVYMTPDTIERVLTDPDTIIKLATELKTEREKRRLAESDNARLSPLAEYTEKVLHTGNLLTTTQIAKDYGMSCANFNKLLSGLKMQYKVGGQWVLYAQYAGNGYTKDCTALYDNGKQSNTYTKWTPVGRKFLFEKLKDNGIYPDYKSDN